MAALIRPTIASYDVHESFVVDTQDHEDHTFCGVMFDVQCKDVLPLECVLVESLWVRGRLGPLTVWTTKGTFRGRHEEPDRWKRVYAGEHAPASPRRMSSATRAVLDGRELSPAVARRARGPQDDHAG